MVPLVRALPAQRVPPELTEPLVLLVRSALMVLQVHLALRVLVVQLEQQGPLVLLE